MTPLIFSCFYLDYLYCIWTPYIIMYVNSLTSLDSIVLFLFNLSGFMRNVLFIRTKTTCICRLNCLLWCFDDITLHVMCRAPESGGATGDKCVILADLAELAGANCPPLCRQPGARITRPIGWWWGTHCPAKCKHHWVQLQVRTLKGKSVKCWQSAHDISLAHHSTVAMSQSPRSLISVLLASFTFMTFLNIYFCECKQKQKDHGVLLHDVSCNCSLNLVAAWLNVLWWSCGS